MCALFYLFILGGQTCACGGDFITQPYFLVVKWFLVHRRKLTTPLYHGVLQHPALGRGASWHQRVPQGCLQGCWCPRGSRCPVTSGPCTAGRGQHCPGSCLLPQLLPWPLTQESGKFFPSACVLPGFLSPPARPPIGVSVEWGVCTNVLCLLSPSGPLRLPPSPLTP